MATGSTVATIAGAQEVVAVGRDVDVLTETVIRRPVTVVGAFAGDPGNAPEWYVDIDSVEWQTTPPVAVGSRMAFVARFLGRRLAYAYEVTELVPRERLVMRTARSPWRPPTPWNRSTPAPPG